MKNKLFVLLSAIFGIALCACSDDFWESRQLYYKTDYGKAPKSITVQSDDVLTSEQLPSVMVNGRVFQGWYRKSGTIQSLKKYNARCKMVGRLNATVGILEIWRPNDYGLCCKKIHKRRGLHSYNKS